MRIKEIERHQPILKLMAGYMTEVVVVVTRIDDLGRLSFAIGRTIEMTVDYEEYDSSIQPNARVLVNIETGEVSRINIEQKPISRPTDAPG
jgi:hypothetical protein